jgi:hypothetical protein
LPKAAIINHEEAGVLGGEFNGLGKIIFFLAVCQSEFSEIFLFYYPEKAGALRSRRMKIPPASKPKSMG